MDEEIEEDEDLAIVKKEMNLYKHRDTARKVPIVKRTQTWDSLHAFSLDESDLEEEFDDKQYKMLGTEKTAIDKLIGALSHPKYQTSMYNINGRQIFSTKLTLISFLCLMLALVYILSTSVYPLLVSRDISTTF